jgi:hypothetical protein
VDRAEESHSVDALHKVKGGTESEVDDECSYPYHPVTSSYDVENVPRAEHNDVLIEFCPRQHYVDESREEAHRANLVEIPVQLEVVNLHVHEGRLRLKGVQRIGIGYMETVKLLEPIYYMVLPEEI